MSLLKNIKTKGMIDFSAPTPEGETRGDMSASPNEDAPKSSIKGITPGGLARNVAVQRNEIFKENEDLKKKLAEWDTATIAKRLDPKLIIPGEWANRHEDSFNSPEFKELLDEISTAEGNTQPIKVRPVSGTNPQQYEIVFGHRRHRACLLAGLPVLALIDNNITTKDLFIEMDRENRQRSDLRPFELGDMYRRALDKGLFPTATKLFLATGANQGNSSLALKLARMPAQLLDAFPSPLDIQFRWIAPLSAALETSPETVLEAASQIALQRSSGKKIDAKTTQERLLASVKKGWAKKKESQVRTICAAGAVAATVKNSAGAYQFKFEKNALSRDKAEKLVAFVQSLLDEH